MAISRNLLTMAGEKQPLLTPKQVQKRLGICAETLNRYRRSGKLKAVKINSRVFRFHLEEIERLER